MESWRKVRLGNKTCTQTNSNIITTACNDQFQNRCAYVSIVTAVVGDLVGGIRSLYIYIFTVVVDDLVGGIRSLYIYIVTVVVGDLINGSVSLSIC